MTIPLKVNNTIVCDPIKKFLHHAEENGYHIVHQELEDYHFNQLRFVIKSSKTPEKTLELCDCITQPKSNVYACDCHWSKVEIAL